MLKPGQTAEEFLSELREELDARAEQLEALLPLYSRASEEQQIAMMGPLDDSFEMRRAMFALDEALCFLSVPEKPLPDADRG